jgi:hypothetical protein
MRLKMRLKNAFKKCVKKMRFLNAFLKCILEKCI